MSEGPSITITEDMRRDIGNAVVTALGAPSLEKALVLVELGIGTALASGLPLLTIAAFCLDTITVSAERIAAGERSLVDGLIDGGQR